jgi:zinc protease
LREEKGAVYSAHAYADISHYPKPEYIVGVSFGCKPNKAESLINSVKAIMQDLQTKKPTDEDMQKVKEANKRQYENNVKENGYWIGEIVDSYKNDLEVKDILHYPDLMAHLTKEDIQNAAKQYFKLNAMKEFVLYPEKHGK